MTSRVDIQNMPPPSFEKCIFKSTRKDVSLHVHKISLKNTQELINIGGVWEEKLEILKTSIEEITHDNLLNF